MSDELVVRVPGSSANLGAGFDVLGMALDLHLDVGTGVAPSRAHQAEERHPSSIAFEALGGTGPIWVRTSIPMGRGLGFSGAARVGGAALAVAQRTPSADDDTITAASDEILGATSLLEGHGDNVAASLLGGIVAWVGSRALSLRVGPQLASAALVLWIPDATTATDRSRATLAAEVPRADAVHNLGRVAQFVLAVEHDEPTLLAGATDDRLHQAARLEFVPEAQGAIDAGMSAGAWCAWLSGSGPTVALFCPIASAGAVTAALPPVGHTKTLRIARRGAHLPPSPVR